ncbi:juvenile hormone acid O-methyltransferase [Culicoides brevitarsis]|uniref:juvenile hormone acid O-methyltransferase n=1 Tax=Culicoides brevitarsis TaxID=469753 RepID=UPI00307CB083
MDKAKLYQRSNNLQREDTKLVLDEYSSLLKFNGSDTIMDVGCGSGDVTIDLLLPRIPPSFTKLVGTDISEPMVRYAKDTYEHLPRIVFEHLDITAGVIENKKFLSFFDHVTSFFCLHWCQNQRQAFHNISRLLKPGGDCLITLLVQSPIYEVYERMAQSSKWQKYMMDVDSYISPYQHSEDPIGEINDYLDENGFCENNRIVEIKERLYIYPDTEILKRAVKSVNPFIKRLMPREQEQFIAEYVQHVTDMGLRTNEDTYLTRYKLVVIYATK